jgi:hypothetical protein
MPHDDAIKARRESRYSVTRSLEGALGFNKRAHPAKKRRRHINVDIFLSSALDAIGIVQDADVAVRANQFDGTDPVNASGKHIDPPQTPVSARQANFSKPTQENPRKNALDFLGFIRPNRDFPMGYEDSK